MSRYIEYNDNSLRKGSYKYEMRKIWVIPFLVALELEVLERTQSICVYL